MKNTQNMAMKLHKNAKTTNEQLNGFGFTPVNLRADAKASHV
jgi:hypothetical protein